MFYSKYLSASEQYEKYSNKKEETEALNEGGIITVQTVPIEEETVTPVLSYSAILEPIERVEIYSKVSGRIENFFVKEGDSVVKGQKLVKLDSLTFELDLAKQQAALDSSRALLQLSRDKLEIARRNVEVKLGEADKRINLYTKTIAEFERFSEIARKKEILWKEKVISDEDMENIKLELNTREINVNNAKRDLEMILIGIRDEDIVSAGYIVPQDKKTKIELIKTINTKIEKSETEVAVKNLKASEVNLASTEMLIRESVLVSPITGLVAKISRTKGELVNSGSGGGTSVLTLISTHGVYVVFSVNEGDLAKVKSGLRTNITADSLPNQKYNGIIKRVSPLVDQKTHTAEVKVELSGKITELRPGLFVRAEVVIGNDLKAVLVPLNTLVSIDDAEGSVFVLKDKRAYKKTIKLGEKREDRIIVKEGLVAGETLISSPLNRLYDGVLVKPKFQ